MAREEGELSDGELEEDSIGGGGIASAKASAANISANTVSEPSLSDDEGSVSSYNPPSVTSVDQVPPTQLAPMSDHPPLTQNRSTLVQLKTKAKSAILSLLPHRVTFQDFLEEGVDEAILRQLFNEIGIKDVALSDLDTQKSTRRPSMKLGDKEPQLRNLSPQSNAAAAAVAKASDRKATTPQSENPTTKAGVERKDRIAQLLALKAVKTAKSQSPLNSVPMLGENTNNGEASKSLEQLPEAAPQNSEVASAERDSSAQEQVKKKNKAQTDLVRAKMEALRAQTLAKAQAQNHKGRASSSNADPQIVSPLAKLVSVGEQAISAQKRPLASDLFEEAPHPKRQHGKAPPKHDVENIVSEEEGEISDDVGMDIDGSSELSHGEAAKHPKVVTSARPTDLVPGPRQTTLTGATRNGSPVVSTPMRERSQDDMMRSKNEEIAQMRKHIAELEKRRKEKQVVLGQTQSPGPGTPSSVGSPNVSTPIRQLTGDQTPVSGLLSQLSESSAKSYTAIAGTPTTNAAARAEALRRRLMRRKEIQAGLPLLDAEVERTRSKLAEIQQEAERLEQEIKRGLEGRQELIHELEQLGFDSDSRLVEKMRLPELKAARDQILEAQQSQTLKMVDDAESHPPGESMRDATVNASIGPSPTVLPANSRSGVTAPSVETVQGLGADDQSSSGSSMDESPENSDDDDKQALRSSYETVTAKSTSPNDSLTSQSRSDHRGREQVAENVPVPGEDDDSGSVSMSDSASTSSEEYDPEDSAMSAQGKGDGQIFDDTTSAQYIHEADDNEDMSMNTSDTVEPRGQTISENHSRTTVPDQENSDELTESNLMPRMQEIEDPTEFLKAEDEQPKFKPYDSVLKSFRNYRFNPQFTSEIPGGYRSLTYSSKIDPRKVLCASEARGEICQDPACEDQHFAQMGLPDDKILVEMSAAPGIDRDSRNRYVNGLKAVIADLRTRGVKDFEEVASELAAYRRRFEAEQDPLLISSQSTNGGAPPLPVDT
ncbi:hypothetical protein UCRPC4_g06407 [Phaeomoniella chlamydospora]|uniref:Putative zinc-finger domain-containing protein n=1 Tax=Phaeomoniella chlamydospora TaxID=158046 RepID=A0A0G2DYP8_PHACM|nr:hypothetical protein UCRPC4_g06407 [Phaeomoniella chlamydospora]